MQFIIRIFGGGLRKALGTSRTESMSASANIFVGLTEAPLVVRPYIPNMTGSELFAIMCGGLASIAGSVLAGYAGLGVDIKYLLAACFMAAPGGLLFAKLIKPETEEPNERLIDSTDEEDCPVNVIDAAASGASSGLKLAVNVGAMLLAFVGLIALLNLLVGGVGGWFGLETLTVQEILGYIFSPLAWLLGIPWSEAMEGGSFIGQKIILNEFVAYQEFVTVKANLTPRTQGIITFALCGFANLSSIAILLGGLGVMAPSRRSEIARYGLKAVAAASLANFMSAAIAGFFLSFTVN
jgi:CNT family concentrative nucleoside transporter